MRVRVRARGGVVCPSVRVRLHRRSCLEACTDAQMRTRTRTSAAPSAFGCSHLLVHARMDGFTCMRVSMARHRRACIGMHVYVYAYDDIYITIIHLLCTYMHALCMDALQHCAHGCRCVCVPKQIGIGGCTCISRHPFSQIYNVHGHSSIFRYMKLRSGVETRVWACGCGGCARVHPRWAASASGYSRRSERVGVSITHMRVCVRAMRGDFLWLRPVRPRVCPLLRSRRGRTRARCAAGTSPPRR